MQASDWQAQRRAGIVEIVLLRDGGNSAEEIHRLHEVHDQARKHGDVLGELMIHGIAGAELDRLCPAGGRRDSWLRAECAGEPCVDAVVACGSAA